MLKQSLYLSLYLNDNEAANLFKTHDYIKEMTAHLFVKRHKGPPPRNGRLKSEDTREPASVLVADHATYHDTTTGPGRGWWRDVQAALPTSQPTHHPGTNIRKIPLTVSEIKDIKNWYNISHLKKLH